MPMVSCVKETISATVGPQYIDWDQVDLLVGDKDILPDEIREIYTDFLLDAMHRLREFHDSRPLIEREVLAKNSHYLKSASRSLGLVDFANRLGHLEYLHRIPTEPEWDRILTQLERSLAASYEALKERHPSLVD